ncbi:zf-HC2 domain-containing protein [Salinivibrio sp. AR647]|jgi:predicted anti-sigma-YlaC factor YlaD|nr:zf-HC2 domain-containing protein [Salinivibrio sp. AR647]
MMMNCQQATRLLSDALDRELTIKEKAALTVHTSMCSGCRHFGKQMGTIRQISKQFVNGDSPDKNQDS